MCLVIDHLYDIPSKILHVQKGNLNTIVDTLCNHFKTMGSPVMMGGDIDCSSKGIMGIYKSDKDTYLLVVVGISYFIYICMYAYIYRSK